jgi:hypothetical protein
MLGLRRRKPQVNSPDDAVTGGKGMDPTQLVELMQCFPIGSKVRYFPEEEADLALDTIVIAYGINDHLVYTQNDIRSEMDGQEHIFLIDDNWRDLVVRKVHTFCLLIPYVLDDRNDLSYPRKVELLNETRFARGRDLTLISLRGDKGVPHLRTFVRKRLIMKDGYYANHPVVVLETQPGSLNLVDQRQERRLHTAAAATLEVLGGDEACPCTLVDFSESFARVRGDAEGTLFKLFYVGQILGLTIDVGRQTRPLHIEGKIVRRDDEYLVIEFVSIERKGRMVPFTMMDVFEFKATLLQHPETY